MARKTYISREGMAQRYGYTANALKSWHAQGLPWSENPRGIPELEGTKWIIDNIINPLRGTSVKEEMDLEKLREQRAKADLAAMAVKERSGELIPVDYVQSELNRFLADIKDGIRLIPTKYAIEILEHADSKENLKEYLRYLIDGTLEQLEPIFEEPPIEDSPDDINVESNDTVEVDN